MATVWNEDLQRGFATRASYYADKHNAKQYAYARAVKTIQAWKKAITLRRDGTIVNFKDLLTGTNHQLAQNIIRGVEPLIPPEMRDFDPDVIAGGDATIMRDVIDNTVEEIRVREIDHFINSLKPRGGSYAILLCFREWRSSRNYTMGRDYLTKTEIESRAQKFCDESMKANHSARQYFGAWKCHETLVGHGFLTRTKIGCGIEEQIRLTASGEHCIERLVEKYGEPVTSFTAPVARRPYAARGGILSQPIRKNAKVDASKRDLVDFVEKTVITKNWGKCKNFLVPNRADRAEFHRACDELADTHGVKIEHTSSGTGKKRETTVQVWAAEGLVNTAVSSGSISPPSKDAIRKKRSSLLDRITTSLADTPSAKRARPEASNIEYEDADLAEAMRRSLEDTPKVVEKRPYDVIALDSDDEAPANSPLQAAATSSAITGTTVTQLIIDDRERRTNSAPRELANNIQVAVQNAAINYGVNIEPVRDVQIPCADYLWAKDGLLGTLVERKTITDIVGRSGKDDHSLQLYRMRAAIQERGGSSLPVLLIEGDLSLAAKATVYGNKIPQPSLYNPQYRHKSFVTPDLPSGTALYDKEHILTYSATWILNGDVQVVMSGACMQATAALLACWTILFHGATVCAPLWPDLETFGACVRSLRAAENAGDKLPRAMRWTDEPGKKPMTLSEAHSIAERFITQTGYEAEVRKKEETRRATMERLPELRRLHARKELAPVVDALADIFGSQERCDESKEKKVHLRVEWTQGMWQEVRTGVIEYEKKNDIETDNVRHGKRTVEEEAKHYIVFNFNPEEVDAHLEVHYKHLPRPQNVSMAQRNYGSMQCFTDECATVKICFSWLRGKDLCDLVKKSWDVYRKPQESIAETVTQIANAFVAGFFDANMEEKYDARLHRRLLFVTHLDDGVKKFENQTNGRGLETGAKNLPMRDAIHMLLCLLMCSGIQCLNFRQLGSSSAFSVLHKLMHELVAKSWIGESY